ncbi:precorrin-6A synthase [Mumia flava]|uniref:Precorrin-6A synthase n=1 Tax=Mumia flava TaxID=1348852 RepID=A0A0B2BQD7_9ACTN|nr:precorrin-6A synthase (deacetylating) [Mumia flava]PJJ58055.1 precorrin-6A synthase [Mumia flava]
MSAGAGAARRRVDVRVVGIGPGGVDQLTVEAVAALNAVDVFVVADKGAASADLRRLREAILVHHRTGPYEVVDVADPERDRGRAVAADAAAYDRAVTDWHDARAEAYEEVLAGLPEGTVAGFLVWGDPALYDSTLRILDRIAARGLVAPVVGVVPGVSAVSLLAARHGLVLNQVGSALTITTMRRLRDHADAGHDNLVVVLAADAPPVDLPGEWDVWWGGNLGTDGELLLAGPLRDVAPRIADARQALRTEHGWVMDTSLLRRHG